VRAVAREEKPLLIADIGGGFLLAIFLSLRGGLCTLDGKGEKKEKTTLPFAAGKKKLRRKVVIGGGGK